MKNKIANQLHVFCQDVDLETVKNMEFYLRQGSYFRQYVPKIISAAEMVVTIPFEDAMELSPGEAQIQFAFVDDSGNSRASEVVRVPVGTVLKEAGYDPN